MSEVNSANSLLQLRTQEQEDDLCDPTLRCSRQIENPRKAIKSRKTEEDTHSVIINISKPRALSQESFCDLKNKGTTKRARKQPIRHPSETSLKKYTLTGNKPLKMIPSQNQLLSYKFYAKRQDSIKHKQHLGIKLQEKYKIVSTDLRKRLHVPETPDDVQAVTDIDDGYFKYLSGHPLTQYIPLYKSLKFQFHNRLRMRQEIGYRRDCILNFEVKYKTEQNEYDRSVQRYIKQVNQFDEFISDDYQKSMVCLKNWEDLVAKVKVKADEKQILANREFMIQSRLIGLDYIYFMQQKYGRFLYYLSPPSWRGKHRTFAHSVEIEAKGFDLGTSSEEDTFNAIFEKMQKECDSGLVKPVLYFVQPDDLITMFESIEKQQLHNYIRMTQLAPHSKKLKGIIKTFTGNIGQDTALVAHVIKKFEKLVGFCEEREDHLQAKFMKILNGMFYDTVAAIDVLKLQMHLDFCFERLFAEKSSHTSILYTAKALERMYLNYSFKLENITNENIKMSVKQCIEGENKKTKRAHVAARELRLFARLEHALMRAYEKTSPNKVSPHSVAQQSAVRNTKPHLSPKPIVRASSQRVLTEAEIEYLSLFTDWTEKENPANYFHSLSITDKYIT